MPAKLLQNHRTGKRNIYKSDNLRDLILPKEMDVCTLLLQHLYKGKQLSCYPNSNGSSGICTANTTIALNTFPEKETPSTETGNSPAENLFYIRCS